MPKKKTPFAAWLDKNNFTVEQFVREGEKLGAHLNFGTSFKWRRGVMPRVTKLAELRGIWPEIKF